MARECGKEIFRALFGYNGQLSKNFLTKMSRKLLFLEWNVPILANWQFLGQESQPKFFFEVLNDLKFTIIERLDQFQLQSSVERDLQCSFSTI